MDNSFNGVIEAFESLKTRFQAGEISRQEFIDEMKKLRIRDDQGRFWMIGAQTGKWYYFDGKDWVQAEPPSQKDRKAICVFCGFENKLEAESCARCGGTLKEESVTCPKCGTRLEKPLQTCPKCAATSAAAAETAKTQILPTPKPAPRDESRVLRSVRPFSSFLFGGVLGIFLGIVAGAFAGVTSLLAAQLSFLPKALTDLQGNLLGAVIYGLIGGVVGFLLVGAFAFAIAAVLNLVLSLIGGLTYTSLPAAAAAKPKGRRLKRAKAASDDALD